MKALVFGCPHVQPSITLGSAELQSTVQWLVEAARTNQCTHVICLGDTIEIVSKTDLMVNLQVKWFLDQFKALAAENIKVYWMIGNHDVYSENYSGLDIFDAAPNFTVVRETTFLPQEDADLTFWPFQPWMDDPLQWRAHMDRMYSQRGSENRPRILFTHTPIEGMPMGGTKDKGADLKEIALQFDMVVAGHYHIASQFMAEAMSAETPVIVPGCVMAHDFKDLGWFHGAVLLDYSPELGYASIPRSSWLPNPHSHYFYHGDSATLNTALATPEVAALRERLHVRFTDKVDALPYREQGLPTVQVRPKHTQKKTSAQQSFKLEGNPVEDLSTWLHANGHDATAPDLLALGRQYLA